MKITAIYIDDHYFFEKPQTINLGGKYIYTFVNSHSIIRKRNEKYIPNFYDNETITSISAIVGKNGVGKTTLLKELILNLQVERRRNVIYTTIFEEGNKTFISSDSYTLLKTFNTDFDFEFATLNHDTIYYSPFLDYNNSIDGIDLSFDTILDKDLSNTDEIFQANNDVVPLRRLKTKNTLRQFEFQLSKYGKDLKRIFDFPDFEKGRFTFTRHKIDIDYDEDKIKFWNTPRDFTPILQEIYEKINKESDEINKDRTKELIYIQKELLKRYILMDILFVFIKQMEKNNTFLEEGRVNSNLSKFLDELENKDALQSLIDFLDSHFLVFKRRKEKAKLLPVEETKNLIFNLYDLIENAEAKDDRDTRFFDWGQKAIYLDKDDSERLILLNNSFLSVLDKYYGSIKTDSGESVFSRTDRIEGILNFEPSERQLSSGENALLNFYSRLYDYFQKNLIEVKTKEHKPFYYIFLDEPDSGFHPKWKKQFVYSCIGFLQTYFKSLGARIQVVFTTHDPLTLSDILNYNIVYLNEIGGEKFVMADGERPIKSFGANITDLLADSFFVGNGLIGDFAKEKIDDCIDWLRNLDDKEKSAYYSSLIRNIDEPIIQKKLSEMYDEKMKTEISKELLKLQIEHLQNQLKKY